MIGTLLNNRYRVETKLGEGGMGVVYKAHDTLLDRPVAIKALSPQVVGDDGLKRLLREAQAAAKLTHPNIAGVYDVLEDGARRMIVMEYVEGQTLRSFIPLPWERTVELALGVCRALAAAHERGIIHRDIKPENIIVTPDGTAKVMDFGLARSAGRSRLTQSGMIVGTVAYMAPEQALQGTADARSDLYSLGCVLYEALTGKPPFQSDDPLSVISQHLAAPPVAPRSLNAAIPPALDAAIVRLLSKDPAQRFASASDVASVLETVDVKDELPQVTSTVLDALRRSRFVGRDRELAELKGAVDRMMGAEGAILFVVGEPGIGKTRLCQELTVYARLRGCRVWLGQAYERETATPYGPFAEIFKTARHELPDENWQAIAAQSPQITKLLPDLPSAGDVAVPLPPEQEKTRLFEQVAQLLESWSRRVPLVLLVDDLHWADTASLELLHYLARALKNTRVLILGTYRDVEVDLQHPLAKTLGNMNRDRLYQRILLRRLDESAVASMMRASFGDTVAQALVGPVYQETEGNPFFVEEVLRDLVEAGAIYKIDGTWSARPLAAMRVPESIREAVGRRLMRLSEPCRQLLTIASVTGREFPFEIVMHAADLDEDTVLPLVEEAQRSQVIHEVRGGSGDTYTFQHALVRETLYEGLNPRRRARLHRQVGEAYERVYAGREDAVIDDLAYHFGRAEQSQAEKSIRYNIRAAERASAMFAHEGAETRLRVALELAESLGLHGWVSEIHERLGDLYFRLRDGDRSVAEYEHTVQAFASVGGDGEQVERIRLKMLEAYTRAGAQHPDRVSHAQSLLSSELAARNPRFNALALIYLGRTYLSAAEHERGLNTAVQAVDAAASLGDPTILSFAYDLLTFAHWHRGNVEGASEAARQRLALIEQLDDPFEAWDTVITTGEINMLLGDYREAAAMFERAMPMARKMQAPRAIANSLYQLSWVYHGIGRWREAVQSGQQSLKTIERIGLGGPLDINRVNFLYGCMWVGSSSAYLGDEAAARNYVNVAGEVEYSGSHGRRDFVQARILLALDDLNTAARHVAAMPAEWPTCAQCQDLYRMVYGQFYARAGELQKAETSARELLRPEAGRRLWMEGEAHYSLGLVALARGDAETAIAEFSTARDLLERVGHVWTLAMAWKELGNAYARRKQPGDLTHSREAFTRARELLMRHGATTHADKISSLLTTLPAD